MGSAMVQSSAYSSCINILPQEDLQPNFTPWAHPVAPGPLGRPPAEPKPERKVGSHPSQCPCLVSGTHSAGTPRDTFCSHKYVGQGA